MVSLTFPIFLCYFNCSEASFGFWLSNVHFLNFNLVKTLRISIFSSTLGLFKDKKKRRRRRRNNQFTHPEFFTSTLKKIKTSVYHLSYNPLTLRLLSLPFQVEMWLFSLPQCVKPVFGSFPFAQAGPKTDQPKTPVIISGMQFFGAEVYIYILLFKILRGIMDLWSLI